jgi:uncharacterized protein
MKIIVVSLLLVWFAIFKIVFAASFNCDGNISKIENKICKNETLSALDESLNEAYIKAKNNSEDLAFLKSNQISWLKKRNKVSNTGYLQRMYKQRIQFLNSFDQSKIDPFKIVAKTNVKTRELKFIKKNGKYIFNEIRNQSHSKITEFNPTDLIFNTLFESNNEFSYIAHNSKYLILSDHNFSSTTPIVVLDRKSGKELARKNIQNSFVWGGIIGEKLIGIQYNEGIVFELPSLEIKKIKDTERKAWSPAKKVVQIDNKLIIQTPSSIDIYDLDLNFIRTIELPKKVVINNVSYEPGEMVVHEGLVIVGVNGGNVHIYNLDTGELEYTFNSIAKFTSYSIYKNLLWISPIEARNGEKTHVYDLETKGLILTVDMKSDIQIWNEDELVSIEKKFSEPTIFTKIKGVKLLLKN